MAEYILPDYVLPDYIISTEEAAGYRTVMLDAVFTTILMMTAERKPE